MTSLNLSPRTRELLEKIQAITSMGSDNTNSTNTNREPLLHLYVHLLEVIAVIQEVDDAARSSSTELIRTISENRYSHNSNKAIPKEEINELNSVVLPGLLGAIGRGFTDLLLKVVNEEETHTDDESSNVETDILDTLDTLVNKDRNQALVYIFREEIAKRFPNLLSRKHRATGQTLLHYVAEKARTGSSGRQSLDLLLEYIPKANNIGADSRDNYGALPLHWATRNNNISMDFLNGIVAANPEAPMTKDDKGYLPIHWAVSIDNPDMYTIGLLLSIHPGGAATPCSKGNLPLHIAVNRQNPSSEVVSALLHIFPEAAKMHCKKGWLPIHRCVNRPNPNPQVVKILLDIYPKGLQFTNVHLSLPVHCICAYADASVPIVQKLIEMHPNSLSIADEYGYLPLHCIVDNYDPNIKLAITALQQYPEAASVKTKDGFLPLHLIISSNRNPNLELVELLLNEYPDAINFAVEDKVPDTDEKVNIEGYVGPWKGHTWTPLIMAIERNLVSVIIKIKDKMKSIKSTAIDVKSVESVAPDSLETSRTSYGSYISKKSSKKFGPTSSNRNNMKVGIAFDDDSESLGGFGENLRGSLDSIDSDSEIPRVVKTSITAEPIPLRPLSRQLERTGMLMDNIEGGITLKNTAIPRRPKLAPIKAPSGSLKPLSGSFKKRSVSPNNASTNGLDVNDLNSTATSVGLDINDFNSSINSDGEDIEESQPHKIKMSTFDDESISSKGSNSMT